MFVIGDLVKNEKNTMEHESDGDTSCSWINKGAGGLGKKRTGGDYQNYFLVEISEADETCGHSHSFGRPSVIAGMKNS